MALRPAETSFLAEMQQMLLCLIGVVPDRIAEWLRPLTRTRGLDSDEALKRMQSSSRMAPLVVGVPGESRAKVAGCAPAVRVAKARQHGATAGGAVGQGLVPYFARHVIVTDGWRHAYLTLGLLFIGVMVPLALFLRDAPRAIAAASTASSSGKSRVRLLALLSKMFSLAVHWGLRGDNPVKGVERYHEERRERWLSDAELARLLGVLAAHPNRRAANAVRSSFSSASRSIAREKLSGSCGSAKTADPSQISR